MKILLKLCICNSVNTKDQICCSIKPPLYVREYILPSLFQACNGNRHHITSARDYVHLIAPTLTSFLFNVKKISIFDSIYYHSCMHYYCVFRILFLRKNILYKISFWLLIIFLCPPVLMGAEHFWRDVEYFQIKVNGRIQLFWILMRFRLSLQWLGISRMAFSSVFAFLR